MPSIYFENVLLHSAPTSSASALKRHASHLFGLAESDLHITSNGRSVASERSLEECGVVRVLTKLVGGKGGFGSMLRAIGAQIEKTTNREACRDLSGRRLRDINEEQRLRKWLDGQADREKEAADRRHKRLERLCAEPKASTKVDDPVYESERRALPERVGAAVDAGWQASSSSGTKRKAGDKAKQIKKKKLWIDELSDCTSGSEEDEVELAKKEKSALTDSGNDSDRTSESSKAAVQ